MKHSTGGPKTSPDNPPTVGVEEEEEGEGDESWEEEEEGMENGEEEGMENGEEGEGEESGEEEEEEGVESTDGIVTMEYQEPRLAVAAGRYVPPQLRGSGRADREKLQKKVQGLINRCASHCMCQRLQVHPPPCRLSEANMHSITHQLEHLYTLHSRNGAVRFTATIYVCSELPIKTHCRHELCVVRSSTESLCVSHPHL